MSVKIRNLSPELQLIAKEQLHEEPNQIEENLDKFKEWIKKSSHLKSRVDDQFLITFLRGCKYSLEKAKHKLDMFYTIRTHVPELIGKREVLDSRSLEILRLGVMFPTSKTLPDGPFVVIIRPGAYDAEKYHIEEIIRVFMMINDLFLTENDNLAVVGSISILDLKDVKMAHLMQMTPSIIKKMTMLFQDGSPIRQKGVHYINTPPGFEKVLNMFLAFMNEKMKKRVFVHGNEVEKMFKAGIPKEILPTEYGGSGESIEAISQEWERKITENFKMLSEEVNNYGVDERKRIGKPKNPESLFGIDGTFRKLEID